MISEWRLRLRAAKVMGLRGFKAALGNPGLYGVPVVGCLFAAVLAWTSVGAIAENGLLITANPLNTSFYLTIGLTALYFAVVATVSVSRERDSGTLEVLFFGPVDAAAYILAKYLEQMLSFGATLAFYTVAFLALGGLTNFGFPSAVGLTLALSLVLASSVVSFGVFLSSATRRSRTSFLTLTGILGLFLAIQWGEAFVAELDAAALPPALFYGKSLLAAAAGVVGWISPFAYLNRGLEALARQDTWAYLRSFLSSLGYSAILLALAVPSLARKGVRSE